MTDAAQKQQFLACLSDPSRFSLVNTLAGGPRCVTELAGLVGLSQSCTTRHLQALLREGIVTGERQGKRVMYALRTDEPDSHPVLRWACGSIEQAATRGAKAAENDVRRGRRRGVSAAPPQGRRTESAEVTDALVVAHDSSWRDLGDDSSLMLGSPADDLAVPNPGDIRDDELPSGDGDGNDRTGSKAPEPVRDLPAEGARSARVDLDDFLL